MTDISNYPALERIVQRFQRLSEPKPKYEQLIYYAKRLPKFSEIDRIPENKVPGCTSLVYMTAKLDQGKVVFQGDADSQIVKGLVGVLVEGLSGLTPAQIWQISPDFIVDTGLNISLTPSRTNGFYQILQMMKIKASSLLEANLLR